MASRPFDGLRIRYRDSGGPGLPVLLSSGIGGSLEFFEPQVAALGDRHRLIAWDYPGHGLSDDGPGIVEPDSLAAFALRFLDALGIERALLVGNSLGGTIAIRMAGLAPGRVAGLVLAAPAMTGPEVFVPFRVMSLPLLGEVLNRPGKKAVEMQIKGIFHPGFTPSPALHQVITRNVMRAGASKGLLAFLRATLTLRGIKPRYWQRSREILAAIACPVVFVHGRDDVVLPVAQSIACKDLTPGASLEIFESCGHTPQIEQAERFNALLDAALRAEEARG